ncbi:IkappaB kinase complex, IKAP component [Serendipita vermifera]|nr:IkappaB kinase complex, IKAP component [Serendipita vermifera]
MRNLAISSLTTWALSQSVSVDQIEQSNPSSISLDPEEGIIYCATQKAELGDEKSLGENVRTYQIELSRHQAGQESEQLGTYSPIAARPATQSPGDPLILSLHFLQETRQVVLILANGEIVLYGVDQATDDWDVVGAFEEGLEAACWSPDETLLMLATTDGKLVQMTTDFESLHERPLRTLEFGEDAQVNVNWGSKATQFHGSLGKVAAAAATQPPAPVGSSPDDDRRTRISWRGDAAYFAVSSIDPYEPASSEGPKDRRVVRIYDRDTTLQATVEPTAGLEHPLAWRPSGNFIATCQRFFGPETGFHGGGIGRQGRHDIVYFERNGLRRLEFGGQWITQKETQDRWSYKIMDLHWSCDSNILLVWVRRKEFDTVQLWTTGNWHWYLKLELTPFKSKRFTSVLWHPEKANTLYLASSNELLEYRLDYETCTSGCKLPEDLGMVAVVDQGNILLTPFRLQNVPPPAASTTLDLNNQNRPPIHLSLSPCGHFLASIDILPEAQLSLWALNPHKKVVRGKVMDPQLVCRGLLSVERPYQVLVESNADGKWLVHVLGLNRQGKGQLISYRQSDKEWIQEISLDLDPNGRLLSLYEGSALNLWQSMSGKLLEVPSKEEFSSFPGHCVIAQSLSVRIGEGTIPIVVGLFGSRLVATTKGSPESIVISSVASSFVVAGSFLIFVTTAHESVYAPVLDIATILSEGDDSERSQKLGSVSATWEKRRVERGSRIVTAVPSQMNVVLQMPRGNLETISPRPMALEVICLDIDSLEYAKAFSACRKHRIDFDIIVERSPDRFIENLGLFLQQITDVDDLNLFLTSLGRLKTKEWLNPICQGIRQTLEEKDPVHYVNCVLTSYVVESPPKQEEALAHLHKLKATNSQIVEDAVQYIIFLVDADVLFDIALGMYDFALVLLIAQHSRRDPREYLPFLRELKALKPFYQRFRIDDHLKKYSRALGNLHEAGPEHFEEALRYIERHQLYSEAVALWRDETQEYKVIMDRYGDWLMDRREFREASLAFELADKPSKTMLAYEKDLAWKPLFTLAVRNSLGQDKIQDIAYRVAENLCMKKRWAEAAVVYMDYASDIEEAIRSFTNGNDIDEAIRISVKYQKEDSEETIIRPGALDLSAQMLEDLEEMETQMNKQHSRVMELRKSKLENPDAFFGVENPLLHNIDVTTDVSTPITTFTRYTVAPTSTSRSISKRTSRSKRKLDMKNAAGRKGTVEEESYILTSWGKLATRLTALQGEVGKLLPHLLLMSEEHRTEGVRLQRAVIQFEDRFKEAVEAVWAENSDSTGSVQVNESGPVLPSQQAAPPKPPKPEFCDRFWGIRFL